MDNKEIIVFKNHLLMETSKINDAYADEIAEIATVNFDRSGTTVIGKYLLNHSFMMPGMVCAVVSTLTAYGISMLIFG